MESSKKSKEHKNVIRRSDRIKRPRKYSSSEEDEETSSSSSSEQEIALEQVIQEPPQSELERTPPPAPLASPSSRPKKKKQKKKEQQQKIETKHEREHRETHKPERFASYRDFELTSSSSSAEELLPSSDDDEITTMGKRQKPTKRSQRIEGEEDNNEEQEGNDEENEEENEEMDDASWDIRTTFKISPSQQSAVEKLLAARQSEKDPTQQEYFVKWSKKSYLHCSWVSLKEIDDGSRASKLRLSRFLNKINQVSSSSSPSLNENQQQQQQQQQQQLSFNADYLKPERIISESISTVDGTRYLLVKWTGLPYSECTFEKESDLITNSKELISQFNKRVLEQTKRLSKEIKPWNGKRGEFTALTESPKFRNGYKLRQYQLDGLNWLLNRWCSNVNSILADEMGLGKTAQALALMDYLKNAKNVPGPFLVVAPVSTLPQWKRECENWTDLDCIVFHGAALDRKIILRYDISIKDSENSNSLNENERINPLRVDLIITSYETLRNEIDQLKKIHWRYLIADEAHRLKNMKCKMLEEIKQIETDHLLLLTGTPIQNNTEELFSLLNLLDPRKFDSAENFATKFGELHESSQVEQLQLILQPLMLRRLKDTVEQSIAPKEETIIEVELTMLQKKYYRAIYERNRKVLSGNKSGVSLINIVMQLRKCCNHPYLIKNVEEIATEGLSDEEINKQLINASGKLVLIDKLLPKLQASGHKVLIFSQMTHVLDILEDYLRYREYLFERIDGKVQGAERQAAIDRFCVQGSDKFVFLLCTRAGGLGINLQVADTVIIFDSDWNPQNDVQAQARCHRIGQTKDVKVYRLITKNTYERFMFDRASKKLGLDQAILSGMANPTPSISPSSADSNTSIEINHMNRQEIDAVLKYGAYGLIDDDEASKRFVEADIDKILETSTFSTSGNNTNNNNTKKQQQNQTPIQTEPPSTAPSVSQTPIIPNGVLQQQQQQYSLMVPNFSVASFCSDGAKPEIDMNDPEFWQKVLSELPAEKDEDSLLLQPRSRHSSQRYNPRFERKQVFYEFYNEDEDDVNVDDEYDEESTTEDNQTSTTTTNDGKLQVKTTQQHKKKRIWNQRDRQKLKLGLMAIGWNRWNDMHEFHCPHQSAEECEAMAYSLIAACIPFVNFNDSLIAIKEFLGIDLTERGYIQGGKVTTAMLKSEKDDEKDEHKLCYDDDPLLSSDKFKEHLQRIGEELFKKLVLCHKLQQAIDKWPSKLSIDSYTMPCSWGDQQDKDLLIGCRKHGLKNFEAILNDETLSFKGKYKMSITITTTTNASTSTANDVLMVSSDKTLEIPSTTTETTQANEETNQTQNQNQNPISVPRQQSIEWPSVKILSMRLKKIISFVLGEVPAHKKDQQQQQQQQKEKEQKGDKDKVEEEVHSFNTPVLSESWTRKEKTDFYRVLVNHGIPMNDEGQMIWEKVKELAGLNRKSAQMVHDYYNNFYKQCQILLSREAKKQRPPALGVGSVITEKKADEKRDENVDLGEADEVFDISIQQCKKVIQRIRMFTKIQMRYLKISPLIVDIALAKADHWARLPRWWKVPQHDKGLINALLKHGFNWNAIFADQSLPFYEVSQSFATLNPMVSITPTPNPTTPNPLQQTNQLVSPIQATTITTTTATTTSSNNNINQQTYQDTKIEDKKQEGKEENSVDVPRDGIIVERVLHLIELCILQSTLTPVYPTLAQTNQNSTTPTTTTNSIASPIVSTPSATNSSISSILESAMKNSSELKHRSYPNKRKRSEEQSVQWKIYSPNPNLTTVQNPALLQQQQQQQQQKETIKEDSSSIIIAQNQTTQISPPDQIEPIKLVPVALSQQTTTTITTISPPPEPSIATSQTTLNLEQITFPLVLNEELTILALGTIVPSKPNFHVYPLGFSSMRVFTSTLNPYKRCTYHCIVISNIDCTEPLFLINPEDRPDENYVSNTPSGAWMEIINQTNDIRTHYGMLPQTCVLTGEDLFGISNPLVMKLLAKQQKEIQQRNFLTSIVPQQVLYPLQTTTTSFQPIEAISGSLNNNKPMNISSLISIDQPVSPVIPEFLQQQNKTQSKS